MSGTQVARIGGTQMRVGRHRGAGMVRCHYSCRVEVAPAPQESSPSTATFARRGDLSCAVMTDPIIQRVKSFRCRRGQLVAERRNRGSTLSRAGSGTPVARLRPTGQGRKAHPRKTAR